MTISQIKPRRLKSGDTIGIISPASPGAEEHVTAGTTWLEEKGFRVRLGQSVGQTFGYLSGADDIRAADINNMFASPDIDGIICLRGGYGSMRILESVNFDIIKNNPKVFVGYSDITALHLSIVQRTGLVTFHGPMAASDFGKNPSDYTSDCFLRAITDTTPLGQIINPPGTQDPIFIVPGSAHGILTGGNLSLIAATLGTPYEIDTRGKILCIEEVGEAPYRIDRMLSQLLLAGKFDDCAGIVFAVCADCEKDDDSPDFSVEEVLRDRLAKLNKPLLYNLYFGHTADKATIPFGLTANLGDLADGLVITESATIE
ncbi:S66 peptidase family protein [Dendrosporobacter sp. 1207_IL3150]|uniref:S66 peptidase family protein n=1 Tax=Dendrosporobacter sp. 1207_IL3150 TaxID=3084054 RepID=UPI002FDA8976